MISLAYYSSAAAPLEAPELDQILASSQHNNARAGVTGLLCYLDGSFLQFLEGEPDAVEATYRRIARDSRHRSLLKVHEATISQRAFGPWSMAMVKPAQQGDAHQTFLQNLRQIEIAADAEHRAALDGFLTTFRAWLR